MTRAPGTKLGQEFGKRLRAARQTVGMTLDDVQKRTGVNKGHISEIENGKANPTRETMVALASAVGMKLVLDLQPKPPRKRRTPGENA